MASSALAIRPSRLVSSVVPAGILVSCRDVRNRLVEINGDLDLHVLRGPHDVRRGQGVVVMPLSLDPLQVVLRLGLHPVPQGLRRGGLALDGIIRQAPRGTDRELRIRIRLGRDGGNVSGPRGRGQFNVCPAEAPIPTACAI